MSLTWRWPRAPPSSPCCARSGPEAGEPGQAENVAARTGLTVSEVEKLASKKVATVLPRGFGVRGIDGRDPLALTDPVNARQIVIHLLPANTPLPNDTGPYTFHTAIENQRMVGIEVWEQAGPVESEDLADNRKIGEGMLKNLPPRLPAGDPHRGHLLHVGDGLLSVHASRAELRKPAAVRPPDRRSRPGRAGQGPRVGRALPRERVRPMAIEDAIAALPEHWDDVVTRLGAAGSRELRELLEGIGGPDHDAGRVAARRPPGRAAAAGPPGAACADRGRPVRDGHAGLADDHRCAAARGRGAGWRDRGRAS